MRKQHDHRVYLVTRPDRSALAEQIVTRHEPEALGLIAAELTLTACKVAHSNVT